MTDEQPRYFLRNPTQFIAHKILCDPSGARKWTMRGALRNLYAALINALWYHPEMGYMTWSFRTAGYICYIVEQGGKSDPADEGWGYNTYHCCVPGHAEDPATMARLAALGFRVVDPATTMGYDHIYTMTANYWSPLSAAYDPYFNRRDWVAVDSSPVEDTEYPRPVAQDTVTNNDDANGGDASPRYSPASPNYSPNHSQEDAEMSDV